MKKTLKNIPLEAPGRCAELIDGLREIAGGLYIALQKSNNNIFINHHINICLNSAWTLFNLRYSIPDENRGQVFDIFEDYLVDYEQKHVLFDDFITSLTELGVIEKEV